MSGSGRKRLSKWDLREESHFEADAVQDHGLPGKDSRPGWISPEIAGDNGSKWSGMEANDMPKPKQDWGLLSKDPLPGSRASHKDDYTNKCYNRSMEGTAEWDADKSYGTRMSPGLDGWRRHSSNLSDRNDWRRGRSRSRSWSRSRSRSRSPHSFKRDSGYHDRNRNRPRVSNQLCRDFASGRCRRGSSCQFLHQDNQNLDDSWENRNRKGRASRSTPHDYRDYPRSGRSAAHCADFVKGRCHRGSSCKYSHDSACHELSKGSSNDIGRDKENDRSKEVCFSRGDREPCSIGIVTCKFFAAGNCRNGKNCKYSHHSQARASPERKSSTDRWEQVQYSDDRERLWDGPKSSELASGSDVTQLRDDKNEQIEPRYVWSSEQKWGHGLNNESKMHCNQATSIKALQSNNNETFLCKAEDAGGGIGISDPRGHGRWPSDMEMSPDWHYTVPSNHVVKADGNIMRDSGSQTSMALATLSHEIAQGALAKKQDVAIEPITVENSYFRQNHNLIQDVTIASAFNDKITTDKTTASHAEGNLSGNVLHGQRMGYQNDHPGGTVMNPKVADGNFTLKSQDEDASMRGINSGTTITPTIVTSEQITQLTNLSVSLAQYLGNVQPLPKLYATLNPHNASETSSFTYSDASMGALVASIKSDPVIECLKQHDPICNSAELKKFEFTKTPSDCSPNSAGQKSATNGKQEMHIVNLPVSSDPCGKSGISTKALHESHVMNLAEPSADGEAFKEKNGDGDCENKSVQGVNENSQENGTAENVDGNDGVHDRKKNKDAKGVRAFKFALVEFVKELLKPTWKEGHISKDVYKTIVKKVVDKVTGTLQGGHIPQTPEKIDHYLSFSKPKLTKLVQAYVDKVQKT